MARISGRGTGLQKKTGSSLLARNSGRGAGLRNSASGSELDRNRMAESSPLAGNSGRGTGLRNRPGSSPLARNSGRGTGLRNRTPRNVHTTWRVLLFWTLWALGTLWKRSGMLWEHSGDALGMLWGHSGNVLGALWGHSGDTLGTLWGRSGTLSVSISISTSISISISISISNPDLFFIGYLRRFHWLSIGFCFTWLSRVWVWPPHRAPILLNDFVAWLLVLRWS